MIYMRARYMDPAVGRFASEDSKQNGVNWFAYCNNNSVCRVDPKGTDDTYPYQVDEGLYGYFVLANALILFFFTAKFGWGLGSIAAAFALAMGGGFLLMDAMRDFGPSINAEFFIGCIASVVANGFFERLGQGMKGMIGWTMNALIGEIAYFGMCEMYMLFMP